MNKKKLNENHAAPKPLVGLIGCNSPLFLNSHQAFIESLKNSIAQKGGDPLFFGISGTIEGVQIGSSNGKKGINHYGLPSRDMIADQIELILYNEGLKGLVLIPWTINSLVGMVMACARCDIPAIFMPQYSLWSGDPWEEHSYEDCSMAVLLEVLGLTRAGTLESVIDGSHARSEKEVKDNFSDWGAQRILELIKLKATSRRFICNAALHNCIFVDLALGGASESLLHLAAIAREANLLLPLSCVNELSRKIHPLVSFTREGQFKMDEFHKLGGIHALLCSLSPFLQSSPAANGRDILENAKKFSAGRSHFKKNYPTEGAAAMVALNGSLAREGALVRTANLKSEWFSYSGTVKVFNTEELCVKALRSKKINKGDILVLRYCGPRGNPGMLPLKDCLEAIQDKGLEGEVALLTDGRIPAGGKTPAIVHISPEAASGGALAILQDGDTVQWNLDDKSLNLRLTDMETRVRLSRWKEMESSPTQSLLGRYLKYSSSSAMGATLK